MQQQIHFVTGKGGVGKSLVSLGMAQNFANQGLRTLLVELGDHSFFADLLEVDDIAFQPKNLRKNLDLALWTGNECLREYARHLIKVETLTRLFFENPVMRTFINVAPALPELAIMGKLTSTHRNHGPPLPYDVIVVDGYATGHFLSLMRAASGMAAAIQFGPMGEQSRSIDAAIRNSEICRYHIVTLPEELPLKEAKELGETLVSEFGVKPEVIVNKVLQPPVGEEELKVSASSNDELKLFSEYLLFQIQKQSVATEKMIASQLLVKKVALYFEDEPWKLAERIGAALSFSKGKGI